MAAYGIPAILKQVGSHDKDYRYMAANDLQNILLKNDFRADTATQDDLVRTVLRQLEDTSGDITSIAVKCAGLLVRTLDDKELQNLVTKLCERCTCVGKKGAGRDIAAMALKAVVASTTSDAQATVVVQHVVPTLLDGMQVKGSFDVVNECLDLAATLMERFGSLVTACNLNQRLLPILLPILSDHRAALRKRAVSCLAALAVYLDSEDLGKPSQSVLGQLESRDLSPEISRTYLQAIAALSRATGHRFGAYLATAVPLTIGYCNTSGEGDEETLECCLQALETFVVRSPDAVRPTLEQITQTALRLLSYDPNYDDADDMDSSDVAEDDEDAELSEQGGYSDDDDDSWKVRRAATRCLTAVVTTFPDLLDAMYPQVVPPLLKRFKEREEAVKADIFTAIVALIHQVEAVSRFNEGCLKHLTADAPTIIAGAIKQLRDKNATAKTKTSALQMLQALVSVVPACMQTHLDALLPCLCTILEDTASTASMMKVQALLLLRAVVKSTSSDAWDAHVPALTSPLLAMLGERYYKVAAEALRTAEDLIRTLRPTPEAPLPSSLQGLAPQLHAAVSKRLAAQDQDQEVKEAAISCTAAIVALLGDVLRQQVPATLQALLERTSNDVTRMAAVRAWAVIAASQLSGDLATVSTPLMKDLTSFLRKSNRLLRSAAVSTLQILIEHHGGRIDAALIETAVTESAALVTDTDLTVTALTLNLSATVLRRQPKAGPVVATQVLPAGLAAVSNPLLQASALEALQGFFVAIAACKPANTPFPSLLAKLLEMGGQADATKSAQLSVARCVAALCAAATQQQVKSTVQKLVSTIQAGGDVSTQRLALLTLGEIGRSADLSGYAGLQSTIIDTLRDSGSSEDLRGAASMALGGVTGGALQQYLGPLLAELQQQAEHPKVLFLLMSALDGALAYAATAAMSATETTSLLSSQQRNQVVDAVLKCVINGEEDVRGIAAECLGHVALTALQPTLDLLLPQLTAKQAEVRAAVSASLRAMVADGPPTLDSVLQSATVPLLQGLNDSDRLVRRAALQSLSAVAHHKPALLAGQLAPLLPPLYQQTSLDPDLIRTVNLGPFKHRIDDGLETRKAAFEAMSVLLSQSPQEIDKTAFVDHLLPGLQDVYDIKLPCHLLLAKLAAVSPPHVVAALDRLVVALQKTLTAPVKSDAVRQEVDRNEDMLRSCLRAVDAITCIPDADNVVEWKRFITNTVQMPPLARKFDAVVKERSELPSAS